MFEIQRCELTLFTFYSLGIFLYCTERYVAIVKALALRPSSVFSKDVSLGAKKAPTPKLHSTIA